MTDESDRLREALAGRYELGAELGRGGMAIVFRAHDIRHDRDVAIKVLKPGILSSNRASRFLQEIEIQAGLQHPNILPLHDSGEVDGILYYVMPCVTGETLRERLAREGPLPVEDALRVTRDVAEALSYAHSRGVVHRDIKPSNVLLSSGHAVVSDFGIARALSKAGADRLTDSGIVVGTPEYMSPEQGAGDEGVDARSDIYALGCVLFEMLAGEPPYTGRTPQAIIARHIQERLPSLEVVRPNVPLHVTKAVEKCLAKAPADRYATPEELVEALERPLVDAVARRRSRLKLALGSATVAVVTAIVAWLVFGPKSPALDPRKVVVFPLEEHGFPESQAGAGYDVALMTELALDHTDPLRWIDGRKWLDPSLRADISLLTPRLARDISQSLGAGYYIDGVVRRGRDSTTVMLRLHDVAADTTFARESGSAPHGEITPAQLGLRVVPELLPPLLATGREVDLTPVTDRSPAAIALWLQGEREYRQVQFGAALEFYERALAEDSALAFAAIKGAQAASWHHTSHEAEALVGIALSHDSLLPARYAQFAKGLESYVVGEADSAVAYFESILATDPDWSEAHVALGEVFQHLQPKRAPLDSLAEVHFRLALAGDSTFTPALFHLTEAAIRREELSQARALLSRFESVNPDRSLDRQLQLMLRCVSGRRTDWESEAALDATVALRSAAALSRGAYQAACAEAGFRAVFELDNASRADKWGALLGLQGLLVAQGRDREAAAFVDSAIAGFTSGARVVYFVDAIAGARLESEAAEADSRLMGHWGTDYRGATSSPLLWLFGVWRVHLGDDQRVATIIDELDARAAQGSDTQAEHYSRVLSAHLLHMTGDTAAAIEALLAINPHSRREVLDWDYAEPLPYARLKLAELLLARGEYEQAHRVATVFDHPTPIIYLPFIPASLAIRYRAARAMNRSDLADRYRERLLSLGRANLVDGES